MPCNSKQKQRGVEGRCIVQSGKWAVPPELGPVSEVSRFGQLCRASVELQSLYRVQNHAAKPGACGVIHTTVSISLQNPLDGQV